MRAKTEYVLQEDAKGRKVPVKIGMAPVQRDGVEYEFDVVVDLDHEHNAIVGKTRCAALDGAVINKPGAAFAATLREWLTDGAPIDTAEALVRACADASSAQALDEARARIKRVWSQLSEEDRQRVGAAGAQARQRLEHPAEREPGEDDDPDWGMTGTGE
jgi:hypothetical protein